ncbi:unnamed protein product, partial [Rotaria sp. Silwood1]
GPHPPLPPPLLPLPILDDCPRIPPPLPPEPPYCDCDIRPRFVGGGGYGAGGDYGNRPAPYGGGYGGDMGSGGMVGGYGGSGPM